MAVAFQSNAFQSSAFQQVVSTPATAFQPNAFQETGFQILEAFAFQQCAFQYGAFQVEECPQPSTSGGGGGAGRGWARERELLELSWEMRQATQTLRTARVPQARAAARKLADYAAERASLAALQREYEALKRALAKQEQDADLRAAADALAAFLLDEREALQTLALSLELDAQLLIGGTNGVTH